MIETPKHYLGITLIYFSPILMSFFSIAALELWTFIYLSCYDSQVVFF